MQPEEMKAGTTNQWVTYAQSIDPARFSAMFSHALRYLVLVGSGIVVLALCGLMLQRLQPFRPAEVPASS